MPNWVNRSTLGCLLTGDVVLTPSILPGTGITIPVINHIGVIVYVCNVPYIMHIPFGSTPILESLEVFEKSRKIIKVLRNSQTSAMTDKQLIDKYHDIVGRSYNFFTYNCEDFIRCLTSDSVDIGFDQRCGYGCLLLFIIVIIVLLYLLKKQ